MRQEGDRIHVRFTADTPAARDALTSAQPRLAEMAEARGLRLGQTSVDAGSANQGGSRQGAAPQTNIPSAPAGAQAEATDSTTDDRIA
jgi:flagellar hook-length control protein FliK